MDKPRVSKEERLRNIVKSGFAILQEEKSYKQNQIINKFKTLNIKVSSASLSNLLNNKNVGLDVLKKTADGIEAILQSELGYIINNGLFEKDINHDFKPQTIKEISSTTTVFDNDTLLPGFTFHSDGRVSIKHKTNFIQSAQSEIIEVGIRLKTFADYFYSRNEQEFKVHIISLLKRGVKMRFYMLDPDSNEASLYFRDRSKVQEEEMDSINEMKKILSRINKIHSEFEKEQFTGTFELYLYKHVPTNHYLVIDGNRPSGKMMISHYLYGLRRSECPVMEIDKHSQSNLFKKYFKSLNLFIADAKRVIPIS